MNRLHERPLEPGRGRVYLRGVGWFADYRALDGSLYGVWAASVGSAHDWIRARAERLARHENR